MKKTDGIAGITREVERLAKKIRADLRKRATAAGVSKELKAAAAQLRKRAAMAAAQVEKRVHSLRTELERRNTAPAKRSRPRSKAAKRIAHRV